VSKYLPGQAGGEIFRVVARSSSSLRLWTGFAVFVAYAVVSLVIGAVLLAKRDA
jgi:hypothetical protein